MDIITNNRAAASVVLPNGVEIMPGSAVAVSPAEWAKLKKHPAVDGWLRAGEISHKAEGADAKAKAPTGGKTTDPLS